MKTQKMCSCQQHAVLRSLSLSLTPEPLWLLQTCEPTSLSAPCALGSDGLDSCHSGVAQLLLLGLA